MKFYQRHAQCILCQTNVNFVGRQAKVPRDEAMAAYEEAIVAAPQEQVAHLEECRMAVCLDAIRRIKEGGVTGGEAAEAANVPSSAAAHRPPKCKAGTLAEADAAPAAKTSRYTVAKRQQNAAVVLPKAAAGQGWGRTGKRTERPFNTTADAAGSKCRHTDTSVGEVTQTGSSDLIYAAPCHGLLMLLKACRNSLDELEAPQARR